MPKSKKRKGRYTPRPSRPQQQAVSSAATAPTEAGVGTATAVAPGPATPAGGVAGQRAATPAARPSAAPGRPSGPKLPTMPQVNITTELKVIGILTLVIFALIVILYFVLR